MTAPVRIAGAGPAGLAAALRLRAAGREVIVHERARQVGSRFVGDLHGVENWSAPTDFADALRACGVWGSFQCTPAYEVLVSNGRRLWPVTSTAPLFYVVGRGPDPGCLEHGLLSTARAAGVEIVFGSAVRPEDVDIVATGPNPRHTFAIEKGLKFETDAEDLALGLVHPQGAPAGYTYLLIRGGIGCLCPVLFGKFTGASRALEVSRQVLQRQLGFRIDRPRPLGGFGSYRPARLVRSQGALWAGEAAGVQDFLWGFGIRRSLASGDAIAGVFLGEEDAHRQILDHAAAHRVAVVNRALWEWFAAPGFDLLSHMFQRAGDPLRTLRRTHAPEALRRHLLPAVAPWVRRRYRSLPW